MSVRPQTARDRLRQAALDLFTERGFEAVTAAEIAARAGVTERTFFRQFPDKREVLFDGQEVLATALADAVAAAPHDLSPLHVLRHALLSVADLLEANRPYSEPRQRVILSHAALRERDLAKQAALTHGLAEVLVRRGIAPDRAMLAARIGMSLFAHAFADWLSSSTTRLAERLDAAFAEHAALVATQPSGEQDVPREG